MGFRLCGDKREGAHKGRIYEMRMGDWIPAFAGMTGGGRNDGRGLSGKR